MSEEQKAEHKKFLLFQLDKLGQMIAEDDEWGATRRELNREYRRICKALAKLDPETWKMPPGYRSSASKYNTPVANWCKEHKCQKCGGELKQTRSGSLRVLCLSCGTKYQLKTNRKS